MNNPMDRQMEKRLTDRVLSIGREGNIDAFDELLEGLTSKGIAYRYDAKYRIIAEFQIRPDFYLPHLDQLMTTKLRLFGLNL